jgi:hypothetical protein
MSRFRGRPMDGLPGRLPQGEQVLWQSGPSWQAIARHAFHIRLVAVYFALLVGWRVFGSMQSGHNLRYALVSAASCVLLGALGIGLFCLFSWLIARTTTYTITQKRVVLTYGMALPKSLNLPFNAIESADMRRHADGTGDIALRLPEAKRLSYLLLWPHVRSGVQGRAQPVLRCIPAPQQASEILANAVAVAAAAAPATEALIVSDAIRAPAHATTQAGSLAQVA